jgi:hypothetical protein
MLAFARVEPFGANIVDGKVIEQLNTLEYLGPEVCLLVVIYLRRFVSDSDCVT